MSLLGLLMPVLLLGSLLGLGGALVGRYVEAVLVGEAGPRLEGSAAGFSEAQPAAAVAC